MFAVSQNTYHFEIVLLWHLARGEEKGNTSISILKIQTLKYFGSDYRLDDIIFAHDVHRRVMWSLSKSVSSWHTLVFERSSREIREWELQCCRHTTLKNWASGKVRNESWCHTQTIDCLLGLLIPFWLNFKIQNQVPVLNSPAFPHLAQ